MILAGIFEWTMDRAGDLLSPANIFLGILAGASLAALAGFIISCLRRPPSLLPFEGHCINQPWSSIDIRSLLSYLLVFCVLVYMLVMALVGADGTKAMPCTQGEALLSQIVLLQGIMALYLIKRLRKHQMSLKAFLGIDALRKPTRIIPIALSIFLASLPIFVGLSALWAEYLSYLGIDIADQMAITILQSPTEAFWVRAFLFLFAALLAPILEESVFRGILLPILTRQFGAGFAITIVSLIFALLHAQIEGLVPIFVIAVFFSFGYAWTGSLLTPIIMHICFNTTQLVYLHLANATATAGQIP